MARKSTKAAKTAETPAKAPATPADENTNPELAQHPGGAVEVAERDPDAVDDAAREYRKVFVVQADIFDKSFDHAANIAATRQELINHGLRPTGDVTFEGKANRGKRNVELTYVGPVVPANSSETPADVHVDQRDQHEEVDESATADDK